MNPYTSLYCMWILIFNFLFNKRFFSSTSIKDNMFILSSALWFKQKQPKYSYFKMYHIIWLCSNGATSFTQNSSFCPTFSFTSPILDRILQVSFFFLFKVNGTMPYQIVTNIIILCWWKCQTICFFGYFAW